MASSWRQRIKLIKEQDARFGTTGSEIKNHKRLSLWLHFVPTFFKDTIRSRPTFQRYLAQLAHLHQCICSVIQDPESQNICYCFVFANDRSIVSNSILCTVTLMLMKLRLHSLARTPANKVLPVPGAPYKSSPDRRRNGHCANNSGNWKDHDGCNSRFQMIARAKSKEKHSNVPWMATSMFAAARSSHRAGRPPTPSPGHPPGAGSHSAALPA